MTEGWRLCAIEDEVEVEAVQHQDSGIRFRDGDMPPPGVLPAGLHTSAIIEEDERPPDYGTGP